MPERALPTLLVSVGGKKCVCIAAGIVGESWDGSENRCRSIPRWTPSLPLICTGNDNKRTTHGLLAAAITRCAASCTARGSAGRGGTGRGGAGALRMCNARRRFRPRGTSGSAPEAAAARGPGGSGRGEAVGGRWGRGGGSGPHCTALQRSYRDRGRLRTGGSGRERPAGPPEIAPPLPGPRLGPVLGLGHLRVRCGAGCDGWHQKRLAISNGYGCLWRGSLIALTCRNR